MSPPRTRPKPEPSPLALRIRGARDHAVLTQDQLAAAAGLHNGRTVWRIESENAVPDALETAAIASACSVDPGWLLTGEHPPSWFDTWLADRDVGRPLTDEENDADTDVSPPPVAGEKGRAA